MSTPDIIILFIATFLITLFVMMEVFDHKFDRVRARHDEWSAQDAERIDALRFLLDEEREMVKGQAKQLEQAEHERDVALAARDIITDDQPSREKLNELAIAAGSYHTVNGEPVHADEIIAEATVQLRRLTCAHEVLVGQLDRFLDKLRDDIQEQQDKL